MPSNSVTIRHAAVDAPVLLLVYGLTRVFDGLDGSYEPGGLLGAVGHLAAWIAMALFALLAVTTRALVPPGTRGLATLAGGVTIAGVAGFLWLITGDPAAALHETGRLPGILPTAGLLLFALGMLTTLGLLVAARQVPAWSPLLFGAGIAAVLIDIDLLPFAALILLAALAPLARPHPQHVPSRPTPSRIMVT